MQPPVAQAWCTNACSIHFEPERYAPGEASAKLVVYLHECPAPDVSLGASRLVVWRHVRSAAHEEDGLEMLVPAPWPGQRGTLSMAYIDLLIIFERT